MSAIRGERSKARGAPRFAPVRASRAPYAAHRTLRGLLYQKGKTHAKLTGEAKSFRLLEREHANDLWQGDMLVGPYLPDPEHPGKFRRTALFAFIDDYSRLVPYGEFFFEESLPRLKRVLNL